MLQAAEPRDYVVATGQAHTVRDFGEAAFGAVGLDFDDFVHVDAALERGGGQVADLVGDSSAARAALGWAPTVSFEELVRLMVEADVAAAASAEQAG